MSTLYYDLIAQRAAAVARIADMTHKASAGGADGKLWESMLRMYIDGLPTIDKQIEYARAYK
jgi:hypothetical protein